MEQQAPGSASPGQAAPASNRAMRRRRRWIVLAIAVLVVAVPAGWVAYNRLVMKNFHTVVDGQVYRSAQPGADDLRRWHDRYGLASVICLRGESYPQHAEEEHTARSLGMTMVDVRVSALKMPSAIQLRRLVESLETLPRPILLHCQYGADRTGVASVMAAMAIGGQEYASARGELSLLYGHVDHTADHIGGLLDEYEAWCAKQGVPTGGWQQFRKWATEVYHPAYYMVEIAAPKEQSATPGQSIILNVTITNRSNKTIPAGKDGSDFKLAVFLGSSEEDKPDRELAARVPLPRQDIPSGRQVRVQCAIVVPAEPGKYAVHFDIVEEQVTWFARQGSPVGTMELTVDSGQSTGK